jgi:hypothetical protein
MAGLLYLLCFEHVDNLGAYSIPSETGLLIPSVYVIVEARVPKGIGVSNLGLLRKSLYFRLGYNYNERMRRATGIVLIALGVIGLTLSAVVLLRLPVPLILQSLVGIIV